MRCHFAVESVDDCREAALAIRQCELRYIRKSQRIGLVRMEVPADPLAGMLADFSLV